MKWKIEEREPRGLEPRNEANGLAQLESQRALAEPEFVLSKPECVLGRTRDWTLDFAALIGLPSSFLAVLASSSVAHAALVLVFITASAAALGRTLPRMLTKRFRRTPIVLVALASGLGMSLVTALPTLLQSRVNLDATAVASITSLTLTSIFTASYIASRALKMRLAPVRLAMPAVFLLGAGAGWSLVLLVIRLQQLLH